MRVIEPITITDAILNSSNVTEDDYAVWNIATAYVVGDKVISTTTHRIYEAVLNNTGNDPTTDDGTNWVNIGATNRWKAFDRLISDPVTKAGDIIYTLEPGQLGDAVAFFGMNASSVRVQCVDPNDGIIYDETRTIVDNSAVFDWWTYLFEPISYETQEVFSNVPIYSGVVVNLTVTSSGTTELGQIVIGRNQILGDTLNGTSIGINDYSRKDRDDFGNAIIIERAFAQTVGFQFSFPTEDARRVAGILARLRATPAVYYAGDSTSKYGTSVYGFFRDFDIPLTTSVSFATLEVEGLT